MLQLRFMNANAVQAVQSDFRIDYLLDQVEDEGKRGLAT